MEQTPMKPERAAMIIGASGDIGGAVAAALADMGFALTLTHYEQPSPVELPEPETNGASAVRWCRLDVTDAKAVREVMESAIAAHGPPYAVIYCAGVLRRSPLMLMAEEQWRHVLDVNLTGAFHCLQVAARTMSVARRGRIVLLGSAWCHEAPPGQAAYAASKAGLEALCRVTAAEVGRFGVTCNVVAPGAVESRSLMELDQVRSHSDVIARTPLRRVGRATEVASAVRHLLTEEAGFITGQTLRVDGGAFIG